MALCSEKVGQSSSDSRLSTGWRTSDSFVKPLEACSKPGAGGGGTLVRVIVEERDRDGWMRVTKPEVGVGRQRMGYVELFDERAEWVKPGRGCGEEEKQAGVMCVVSTCGRRWKEVARDFVWSDGCLGLPGPHRVMYSVPYLWLRIHVNSVVGLVSVTLPLLMAAPTSKQPCWSARCQSRQRAFISARKHRLSANR